jgi:serine/threonine protein kinase
MLLTPSPEMKASPSATTAPRDEVPKPGAAPQPAVDPALPDLALPIGTRLGAFEIVRVKSRSASTIVYFATDHALLRPVAIQEYVPARFVRRVERRLNAIDPWREDAIERGHQAFVDEARVLAGVDHPGVVRVSHLFEANGTAYRVMPVYSADRLFDVRQAMTAAPSEESLRDMLDDLMEALTAIHATNHAHGNITPSNILLLEDDHPLLLGPGAAEQTIETDLVETLMANLEAKTKGLAGQGGELSANVARDVQALGRVMRFCILGEWAAPQAARALEPLSVVAAHKLGSTQPVYSHAFLSAIDAACVPMADDERLTVAKLRDWLKMGVPHSVKPRPPVAKTEQTSAVLGSFGAFADTILAPQTDRSAATARPLEPTAAPRQPRPESPATNAPTATEIPPTSRLDPYVHPVQAEEGADYASEPQWWINEPPLAGGTAGPMSGPTIDPLGNFSSLSAAGQTFGPKSLPGKEKQTLERKKMLFAGAIAGLAVAAIGAASWSYLAGEQDANAPTRLGAAAAAAALDAGNPPTDAQSATQVERPVAELQAPPQATIAPAPVSPAPVLPSVLPPVSPPPRATAATPPSSTRQIARSAATAPLDESMTGALSRAASPRSVCAPRTEFALYRCMELQCKSPKWSSNAQCISLRAGEPIE